MKNYDLTLLTSSNPTTNNVIAFPGQRRARDATLEIANRSQLRLDEHGVLRRLMVALDREHLGLHYQTQVNLESGEIRGVEALMRLDSTCGAAISPERVVAVAERHELIGELGRSVLFKACNQYSALKARGIHLGRLAVNVSPLELDDDAYAEFVSGVLAYTELEYSDLEFEITEGHSMMESRIRIEQLNQLADAGASLALDDFGSGYASWSHLLDLPLNTLKIDKTLIRPLDHNTRARTIVNHICRAASELDVTIVAEGVNTPRQRQLLLEAGCRIGQGFAMSRPMPLTELASLLAEQVTH